MKKLKIFAIIISSLILILLVAGFIFLKSFDVNEYKPMLENTVTEALGREVKIGSDIDFAPALRPTIVMHNVTVANPSWASAKNMVEVRKIFVSFSLLDLIFAKIKIKKIEIDAPKIFLEVAKNGDENWNFGTDGVKDKNTKSDAKDKMEKEISSRGFSPSYEFDNVIVNDAEVSFHNFASGFKQRLNVKKFTLDKVGHVDLEAKLGDDDLTVEGSLSNISGVINGEKYFPLSLMIKYQENIAKIDGKIGDIFNLSELDIEVVAEGKNIPVIEAYNLKAKLSGSADALRIEDINAKAGDSKNIAALISGKIKNVNAMAGVNLDVNIDAVDPSQLGIKPFKLDLKIGEIKGTNSASGKVNFRAGKSDISGDLSIDAAGKIPYIKANLKSGYFSGEDIFADEEKSVSATGNVSEIKDDGVFVFSDDPIPFNKLSDFNADIKADFAKVFIYDEAPAKLSLTAKLRDALLVADVVMSADKTKKVSANLRVNAKEKTAAKITLDAVGEDIILADWMHRLFKNELKGGVANITLKAETYGDSLHILMSHFTGNITMLVENMKVGGGFKKILDNSFLDQLFKVFSGVINKDKEPSKDVELQCFVANLNFVNGKADFNKKIALESNKAFITASGDLNVGTERMDLSFAVTSRQGLSTGISDMISSMIKVNGSFVEPKVSVNAGGVITTAATIGAAVATGGISYLGQKLLGQTVTETSPCAEALGRPVKSSSVYKKANAKSKAKQEPVSQKTTNKKSSKSFLDDLKKVIKIE